MAGSVSLAELEKAIATLNEALDFAKVVQANETHFRIARDACIQRFEYCIELAWKVAMKKVGSPTKFPKPAIREMARGDLVDSAEAWLQFIDARNDSSHSYDEETAMKVFASIQKFSFQAQELVVRLKRLP